MCVEVETETRERDCERTCLWWVVNRWTETIEVDTKYRSWRKKIDHDGFVLAYDISFTLGTPIGVGGGITCKIVASDQADANSRCGTAPHGTAWTAIP